MEPGTRLGPLLFIMYMHDVHKCISPKFADDLVALTIRSDLKRFMCDLQHAVDELVSWSQEWGMSLNETKTKVILFGGRGGEVVNVNQQYPVRE